MKAFYVGLVADGFEEPASPAGDQSGKKALRWSDMPEIPPVLVVRMRIGNVNERGQAT
ncbi:MAG: hypothetical protein HPY52_12675 [Firmicutes bacterium]|nr:hypothetical protein [Bacillota bacterium]